MDLRKMIIHWANEWDPGLLDGDVTFIDRVFGFWYSPITPVCGLTISMRLSKQRIESLSQALVDRLVRGKYIQIQMDRSLLVGNLEKVITDELMVEDHLNEEVRQILKAYESEINQGDLDYRKMFQMTKKQLVHNRGIIL